MEIITKKNSTCDMTEDRNTKKLNEKRKIRSRERILQEITDKEKCCMKLVGDNKDLNVDLRIRSKRKRRKEEVDAD